MAFAGNPMGEAGFRHQAAVLRRRILLILLASITVVFLAGSLVICLNAIQNRHAVIEDIGLRAIAVSAAFDREVTAALFLLQGLSQSPALVSGDLAGFHAQLMRTPRPEGSSLVLWDMDGQLLNTLLPLGKPLPRSAEFTGFEQSYERLRRKGFSVSNRTYGPVARATMVAASLRLDGPDGRMSGFLTVVLPQTRLDAVAREGAALPGAVTVLFDRGGGPVAASTPNLPLLPALAFKDPDAYPPDRPVVFHDTTGAQLVQVKHSDITDYTTMTWAPLKFVNAPVRAAAWQVAAVGLALVLAGSLAGLMATRQVRRVASAAVDTARQLDHTSARYASLWNDTPDGLFVVGVTPDGRFVYEGFNPAHARATGLAFEAVAGKEPSECLPPPVAAAVTRRYRDCIAKGAPMVHDEVLDLPVGRRHWQTSLVPVRDPETGRIVAIVGMARDMTDIAKARQDVNDIATRFLSVQDDERRRIASDLHDTTGQHIVAAVLALMLIEEVAGDRPGIRDTVAKMRLALAEAQKEIRTVSYLLYPPQLRDKGFETTLRGFVAGFTSRTGLDARLRISGDAEALPTEIQGTVLRVLQEALVNVHRHADARRVTVILRCGGADLALRIADDGKGIDTADAGSPALGVGIPGMEARIHQVGGRLTVTSNPRGTSVQATIPLADGQDGAGQQA